MGFVQQFYERVAVMKTGAGLPVYAFWDKECLNDGQNWEKGFVAGLRNAQAIILLISRLVCTGTIYMMCY